MDLHLSLEQQESSLTVYFALYLFCFQFCTVLIQLSGLESEMLFRLYALNEDGNKEINQLIDQSI